MVRAGVRLLSDRGLQFKVQLLMLFLLEQETWSSPPSCMNGDLASAGDVNFQYPHVNLQCVDAAVLATLHLHFILELFHP